jgi:hypothetical protein
MLGRLALVLRAQLAPLVISEPRAQLALLALHQPMCKSLHHLEHGVNQ